MVGVTEGTVAKAEKVGDAHTPRGTAEGDDASKPPPPAPPAKQYVPHDGKTAWQQLMSLDFIFLASWFTVVLLPTNFFIISIGDQLEDMVRGCTVVESSLPIACKHP